MAEQPGTFEQIAMMLGDALSPLAARLDPAHALDTIAQLGLAVPVTSLTTDLGNAFGTAATAAGQLPALVTELVDSIHADAGGLTIAAKAVPLAEKVGALIDAFVTIGNRLGSAAIPGLAPAELNAFVTALPGRLLEMALIEFLDERQKTLSSLLGLLGLIDRSRINAGSPDPLHPEVERKVLRLDRVGQLFSSPEQLFTELYGWGQPAFDDGKLLGRIADLLTGVGLPVARTVLPDGRPAVELFLASIAGTPAGVVPRGLDLSVMLALADGFALQYPIASGLELDLRMKGALAASVGMRVQPPANFTVIPPAGSVQGEVAAGINRVPGPSEETVILLGIVGGTRLEARRIGLSTVAAFGWDSASGQATGDFGIDGRVEGGKLVISLDDADGFVGSIVAGLGLEASFDLGFGWRAGGGIYFTGSGALEVQLPSHIELGPIEISAITLSIGVDGNAFPISLSATIKGELGPMAAVVEGMGATARLAFPPNGTGNLGFADLSFGFKPPNGVGLSIDVGVLKGGGYLFIDAARGEYAGALELVLAEIVAVRAIGLITTKMPDGSDGFSMLLVITAEFPGGIQLGFGFTLLGVGGIIGLNRTMNLQALMEGVRTNAIESVMFPHDVVANAPRILSDLRAFFPEKPDTFLIGPMLKIGWGTPTLISVSVGVIIEIPGNIAIVGIIKIALPTDEAAILKLQVNFAGAIEFDKQRLYFFASLYDSRILMLTIQGELGLLVAWGDDANFVLSVGGFHPRFTPPPLPFPSPVRVSIDIIHTSVALIRVSGYFAVTSNTAQFGAKAELKFDVGVASVEGYIAFDALFQFSPFWFIVEISASVSLKVFGMGLFSIHLQFSLEGPTPWRAKGSGEISFLFFSVSADFDITWGDSQDTSLPSADVLPLVAAELTKDDAWKALAPAGTNLLVTLRSAIADAPGDLVLHPVGSLQVRQRAVPLDLKINKVGNQKVKDANRFSVAVTTAGFSKARDLDEQFAGGQYLDMSDADKVGRRAFEPHHGGVEIAATGAGAGTGRMVTRIVRYEEIIIDNQFRRRQRRFRPMHGLLFAHFLGGASIARSPLSFAQEQRRDPHADHIVAGTPTYAIAGAANNSAMAAAPMFVSEAAALDHLAQLVADDPNLVTLLHVLPAAELNGV